MRCAFATFSSTTQVGWGERVGGGEGGKQGSGEGQGAERGKDQGVMRFPHACTVPSLRAAARPRSGRVVGGGKKCVCVWGGEDYEG